MKAFLILAATAAFASPVLADEITLDAATKGESLHAGAVDMTAYYTPAADAALLEVTATYVARDTDAPARRLVLGLRDGDSVSFELPGLRDITYTFARAGEAVSVSADPELRTASAN